jgi:hypothetical protein
MDNQELVVNVQAYLKGSNVRTELSNTERDEELQYILQTFLTAGDEARAIQDLVKAERFYHETIKVAVREFDKVIPEIALAKFHLSMIYLDRSELKAAEAFAKSALDVFVEIFGAEHPATAMAMHQLGEVHLAQNKTEAATMQKQAAKLLARTYGQYRSSHTDPSVSANVVNECSKLNLSVTSFDKTKQTGISKN